MGRESEAGYSLNPDASHNDARGASGDGNQLDHSRSPGYINNPETQLQLHSPPSPTLYNGPSSSSSYQQKPTVPKQTWKRFAVPTKSDSLSSGFPFHPHLYNLKITHDQWHLFTSDVVNAAKMTATEDYLAWTTGITTGTLTSPFLLVLAPVVGYYSGKAVHKKTLVKTVKEKLGEEGGLRGVLRRWNEQVFVQKGFQAWLELPRVSGELHKDTGVSTVELEAGSSAMDDKKRKKVEKKAARRFRIILVPVDEVEDHSVPAYGSIVDGTASSRGSETGSVLGSERGLPAPSEMDNGSHRQTLPPAYWDANAVGDFNGITNTNPSVNQNANESQLPSPVEAQPQPRPQREEPLGPEIRYTRMGGFTNA